MSGMGGAGIEVQTIVKGSERRRLTILYSTSKRDKIHSGAPQAVWVKVEEEEVQMAENSLAKRENTGR